MPFTGYKNLAMVIQSLVWEFGRLRDRTFTKNIKSYTIYDLDKLFNAVNYVFEQCQLQINP